VAEFEGDPGAEDIRAALAEQLLQLRPRDLLAQTAVMLANQAAIRLGLASTEHKDREQAREAIDALAGIVELLAPLSPADELEALRRDLAQLRMAFVQSAESPAPAAAETPPEADTPPEAETQPEAESKPETATAEDDDPSEDRPSIWTPGGEV